MGRGRGRDEPEEGAGLDGVGAACAAHSASRAANGLFSRLGCSLMGVYAVPTGPMRSSSAGFVGAVLAGRGGADAAAYNPSHQSYSEL